MAGSTGEPIDPATIEFDLAFIDLMIPHHRMALGMAELARVRSTRTEVVSLAASIIATQQSEIDRMTEMREAWYRGTPTLAETDVFGAFDVLASDSPGQGGFAGMEDLSMAAMTTGMARLCAATDEFDLRFLNEMIPHHEGAILIGQVAVEKALHPELVALAQGMVDAQQAELSEMLEWRDVWFGGVPNYQDPNAAGTPTA